MSADSDASEPRDGTDRPTAATEAAGQDARVLAAVLRRLLHGETVSPASLDPARDRFAFVIRLVRGGDVSPAAFSDYVHWLASRRE